METFVVRRCATLVASLLAFVLMTSALYAGQSTITIVDGAACMGDDKSRKQTENEALANVKIKAVEYASTYLKSEMRVKNFQAEKYLVDAYANATIKIVEELEKGWYKDAASGECYKLKVKAEVIPDDKAMAELAKDKSTVDDPNAPLQVQLWTDKKEYRNSEKIKIYIKGNKPFYARVLHKDARGNILQLLPNIYRTDNYFNGGVVYEIPSGNDRFELEVTPPFGEENIIAYGSLTPLGDLDLQKTDGEKTGGVYLVNTMAKDIGIMTRGIKLKDREEGLEHPASEFFEGKATLRTGK